MAYAGPALGLVAFFFVHWLGRRWALPPWFGLVVAPLLAAFLAIGAVELLAQLGHYSS